MRWPWTTLDDRIAAATYRLALERIVDLENQVADVRRHLTPMLLWPDLDEHTKGHIAMMLHITNQKLE